MYKPIQNIMQANTFKVKIKEKAKKRERQKNYFKTITIEHQKKYNRKEIHKKSSKKSSTCFASTLCTQI